MRKNWPLKKSVISLCAVLAICVSSFAIPAAAFNYGPDGGPDDTEIIYQQGGVIQRGDVGKAVKDLQETLFAVGYYYVGVDGYFGAQTESAVIAFQSAHGLYPDGIVGPATCEKLYEVYYCDMHYEEA
ncbi:MAG TPA: peptidoglycan-binding domain-containing protein [Ruminiclostridium sp.]|nr:peptidoglycan-binding domain-containing protein [Ruminiclostridium sp.]